MTALLPLLLGILYLADPVEAERVDMAVEIRERDDDGGANRLPANAGEAEKLTIVSERADFDRREGVILFEGKALVSYSAGFTLGAERLFVFLAGSNALDRIVAVGNVTVSNETRVGRCAMASYRRRAGLVDMYGNASNGPARLAEIGADELSGRRITFWTDTEQVEVDGAELTFEHGKKVKIK